MERPKVSCRDCSTTESIVWSKCPATSQSDSVAYICNDCYVTNLIKKKKEAVNLRNRVEVKQEPKVAVRKSARIRSIKSFSSTPRTPKAAFVPKVINYKAPDPVLVPTNSERVLCNNMFFSRGDIVCIQDENKTLYAQLRGFLTDQYTSKSAVITWLIPTKDSPPPNERFDPSTYTIGFEEDTPRPLSSMSFVMHAPSAFYMIKHHSHAPYHGDPFKAYLPKL
ncbi:hypothetical protein LSTR_LSTR000480 [Laodelphax striatellus]|uniref:GATA zinc finger domain-containing protein 1 n=1 Tax=Laodelphax striatellus TaxID=195883 RepID=A0A482X2F6_LAOST|nr:hypothetical protein LSTR_LSTR000480 [Laodelphax striatellus]